MELEYSIDTIRFLDHGSEKALLREKLDKESVTVGLSGSLSGDVANTLLDEVTALIVAGRSIVIDLEGAVYISPSVMEVLLKVEKRLEQNNKFMRIVQCPQEIYDTFKARGLHELLEIEVRKE